MNLSRTKQAKKKYTKPEVKNVSPAEIPLQVRKALEKQRAVVLKLRRRSSSN